MVTEALSVRLDSRAMTRLILVVSVVLLLGSHLWIGLRADFLPCTLDCGETYEAFVGARNIDRFGWRYAGGLQDYSSRPDIAAHPVLYVHNPNLGMHYFLLLAKLGVREIHAQAAWLTLPFLLGMAYLYLAVKAVTRDRLLAALCLLSAASLYLLVDLWGFHGVRVWSWLLTFGVLYHLVQWGRGSRSRWHAVAWSTLLGAGLGVDYPFAAFLAALALALGWVGLLRVSMWRLAALVVLALGVPFLLRQIQVAAVLGADFWWHDFVYSTVRRVPLTHVFFSVPDPLTLGAYYDAHGVIKWPGGGGPMRLLTWAFTVIRAHAATLGLPSLALALAGVYAGRLRGQVRGPMSAGLALLVAVGMAITVPMLTFGEYLSAFYGVFLMPMVVHWIVLLLGLTSYVLLAHWRATVRWGRVVVPVGALLLVAFAGWRVHAEARNIATLPPVGYPGREALAALPGASVATLWISSAPSAYTDQWAAALQTMRWTAADPRRLPFDPESEYFTFMERDRANPVYRHPDFLLIPRLNTWGLARRCQVLGGAVAGFADGCADIENPARFLKTLRFPVFRRGPDYLLYDLREKRM